MFQARRWKNMTRATGVQGNFLGGGPSLGVIFVIALNISLITFLKYQALRVCINMCLKSMQNPHCVTVNVSYFVKSISGSFCIWQSKLKLLFGLPPPVGT